MIWNTIKKLFTNSVPAPAPSPVAPEPAGPRDIRLSWVEADANPWRVRLLDVRPITQTMLSTSKDPRCAENVLSFGKDDGTSFIGVTPTPDTAITADLRFPIDRMLADGVLYSPREMEHKWAIFVHGDAILVVRSWTRTVCVVADFTREQDHIAIRRIRGAFHSDLQGAELTRLSLDYLLRSHVLGQVYPIPLTDLAPGDDHDIALWCMSLFGRHAHYATPGRFERHDPDRPLRSHSLLHIAVARGDLAMIDSQLRAGIPIDLLAGDGLAPLHWSLGARDATMTDALLERGSPVDVRSSEGATPLMNAVQTASLDKVRLLLERGASADAADARGFTSLHRAAEMGLLDIARLLLEHGASPDTEASGHTPRSFAKMRERKDILELFESS